MSFNGVVSALLSVWAVGCLPDPDLPRCPDGRDDTCRAMGYCRCADGLCFRFDCPPDSDGAGSGDVRPDAATPNCPPAAGGRLPEACVAQVALSEPLGVPAALGADGTLYLVTRREGGGTLRALDGALAERRSPVPLDRVAAPVALAEGGVALRTAAGLAIVDAEGKLSEWSSPEALASDPVEEPVSRDLLALSVTGRLLRFTAGGSVAASEAPVVAAGDEVQVALGGDVLWAVGSDGLSRVVVGRTQDAAGQVVLAGARAAPALDPPYVIVATGDSVASVRDESGEISDAGNVLLGEPPSAPVVGADHAVVVALTRTLVGLRRLSKQSLVEDWTSATLVDATVSPPLLGHGQVYVGLNNGRLVAVAPEDGATTRWYATAEAAAAGAPLQWPDGTLLHVDAGGQVMRLTGGAPPLDVPWPRLRRDAQSSAVAPPVR